MRREQRLSTGRDALGEVRDVPYARLVIVDVAQAAAGGSTRDGLTRDRLGPADIAARPVRAGHLVG